MKTTPLIKSSVILLIVIFFLASCSKDEDEITYDLNGNWKVIYFKEGNTKITKTEDNTWLDINDGDNTANFSELDSNGKGTISGMTVSNGYNGEYTILDNGKISIGPITTTFINQPEWANLFKISAAENFEVRNSRLVIYYNNGNNSITFERN